MPKFSGSSVFLLIFLVFAVFSTAVRSTEDASLSIRLPSNDGGRGNDQLCTGQVPPPSCPVNCFRTDPVCGIDGVTYWCGCADAICSGTGVAKLGFCEVGNGGNGPVSGQALLLVHIVWLIVLGFSFLLGIF